MSQAESKRPPPFAIFLILLLSLMPINVTVSESHHPRGTLETEAMESAINLLNSIGWIDEAKNIQEYYSNGQIFISTDLGTDCSGLTVKHLSGEIFIYVNATQISGATSGFVLRGTNDFWATLNLAGILVHEKWHAEKQGGVVSTCSKIRDRIIWSGVLAEYKIRDEVEAEAYNRELAFIYGTIEQLWRDYNALNAQCEQETARYNAKVDRWNAFWAKYGNHTKKDIPMDELDYMNELKLDMIRELQVLEGMVSELEKIARNIQSAYNEITASWFEDWKKQAGGEKVVEGIVNDAHYRLLEIGSLIIKLRNRRNNQIDEETFLRNFDPPLEHLESIEALPQSITDEERSLLLEFSRYFDLYQKLRTSEGSEKLGIVKPYFDCLAAIIRNGSINVLLTSTVDKNKGYRFESPYVFTLLVRNATIIDLEEPPYEFPVFRLHVREDSIVDAMVSGNVSAKLDEQIRNGEVIIETMFVDASYRTKYEDSLEEIESLKKEMERLKRDYAELEEDLDNLTSRFGELTDRNAELINRIDSLESQLSVATVLNYALGGVLLLFIVVSLYFLYKGRREIRSTT